MKTRNAVRLFVALLIIAGLVSVGIMVSASAETVPGVALEYGFDDGVSLCDMEVRPWGYAGAEYGGGTHVVTYAAVGESPFDYAYTIYNGVTLVENKTASFTTYVSGDGPFIYEYDVYFQKYNRSDRNYSGYAHNVSLSPDYSFTPSYPGRYILSVKITDVNGDAITYYTDSMFTAIDSTVYMIENVARDAKRAGNEYDTVVYIFEWIRNNVEYSTEAGKYEADSGFGEGVCVCSGYAEMFNTLCRAAGIESASVHGYASAHPIAGKEHSWNVVRVEGDWYHIDVTYYDNGLTLDGSPLMTSVMASQTHSFGFCVGGDNGETSVPPWCNATTYAMDYESDPEAVSIRVTVSGANDDAEIAICVGDVAQITGTTSPGCSRHASKIWSTTDDTVAKIDARGVLTAVAPGECYIVVDCGDLSARRKITVLKGE